jgi:hypothetical protein
MYFVFWSSLVVDRQTDKGDVRTLLAWGLLGACLTLSTHEPARFLARVTARIPRQSPPAETWPLNDFAIDGPMKRPDKTTAKPPALIWYIACVPLCAGTPMFCTNRSIEEGGMRNEEWGRRKEEGGLWKRDGIFLYTKQLCQMLTYHQLVWRA